MDKSKSVKIIKSSKSILFVLFFSILIFFLSALPSFSSAVKFAQISDIHYSADREDTSWKLLKHSKELLDDAAGQINAQKDIDFVMITGDGIDRPDKTSLDGLINGLNRLKRPWYITIGNHDTAADSDITKEVFLKEIRKNNKNFKFDKPYYTFKPKRGFRVIVMDGASNDKRAPHGYFPKEELEWLDDILSQSENDTVLIFQHFPLVTPYPSKNHEITNAEEYNAVLKKYKMPIAVLSGHYHAAKITRRDNIIHVSSPALASYPNAFRIIKAANGRKQTVFEFEFYETGLKDLQQTAKMRIAGDKLLYGRLEDRNVKITVKKNN